MVYTASSERSGPVRFRNGGRLALDFVNTVDDRVRPATREDLPDYESIVSWGRQVGILDQKEAALLRRAASSDEAGALAAHLAAIDLREEIYRLFRSIVRRQRVPAASVDRLDAFVTAARGHQHLAASKPNFRWEWRGEPADHHRPLFLVALAAADLLTREDLSRVKQCPGPDGCGWLFFDETKNKSRKWCSMEQCGGVAKAKRFAQRNGG